MYISSRASILDRRKQESKGLDEKILRRHLPAEGDTYTFHLACSPFLYNVGCSRWHELRADVVVEVGSEVEWHLCAC